MSAEPDSNGNWSYALVGPAAGLSESLQFEGGGAVPAGTPFSASAPPALKIIAKVRKHAKTFLY